MTDATPPRTATLHTAARYIGISASTLYKRRQRETNAPAPVGENANGGALYDLAELTRWALRDRAGDGATLRAATIERDDTATCLECGRQLQSLGPHVRVHGLTPDEYRAKHGIPFTAPLSTPHVRAHARTVAIDAGVGRNLTPGDTGGRLQLAGVEHLRVSRREREQTDEWKAAREVAVTAMAARRLEMLLEKLSAHGYDSIRSAVDGTRHLSAAAAARVLDVGATSVRRWRMQYPPTE